MGDRTPGFPPRAMTTAMAAYYTSLSVSLFLSEVEAGRIAKPIWLTERRKAWLLEDLDAYIDRRAGRSATPPSVNDWMRLFDQDGPGGSSLR